MEKSIELGMVVRGDNEKSVGFILWWGVVTAILTYLDGTEALLVEKFTKNGDMYKEGTPFDTWLLRRDMRECLIGETVTMTAPDEEKVPLTQEWVDKVRATISQRLPIRDYMQGDETIKDRLQRSVK